MELYYDQRMQAMLPSQMENLHWNSSYREGFEKNARRQNGTKLDRG